MKKPYLTEETIRKAFSFLRSRKDHAHAIKNKEWEGEFENCLRVIEELSAMSR